MPCEICALTKFRLLRSVSRLGPLILNACLNFVPLKLQHSFHFTLIASYLAQNSPLLLLHALLNGLSQSGTSRHARMVRLVAILLPLLLLYQLP